MRLDVIEFLFIHNNSHLILNRQPEAERCSCCCNLFMLQLNFKTDINFILLFRTK